MKLLSFFKPLALTIGLLLAVTFAEGANRFSVATGNWSSTNTWSATTGGTPGASVPVAGDAAIIERGFTVTVNGTYTCSSLQVGSPGNWNLGVLTFSGTNPSLTVTGAVIVGGYESTYRTGTITFTSGSSLDAGSVTLGGTGPTPAAGTITMTAGGTLTTGSVTVNTVSGNTWTRGTGTVIMDATNAFPATIFTTFNNLTINGGTTTLGVNTSIYGNLTVTSGTLNTSAASSWALTLRGNFVNNGTFIANGSMITIHGTATQSIAGFATTGNVSMTKTNGMATFTGYVNGAGFTINGPGGTLNLGSELIHTFTGTWALTNGTLNGGSSTLKIGSNVTTGGTFTAGTGTVDYYASATQTIAGLTYNNLTLSGTSAKTFPTGTTVNGILSREGTATITLTGTLTYGANATLQYKGSTAQTTGAEFPATWSGSGGVKIENVNGVTLNVAKNIGANPFTIGSTVANSIFKDGGFQLTASGTLNLTSGTFKLGAATATTFPAFATNNIAAGTTVEYAATATQTVKGLTYSNLTVSGTGTNSKTAGTNITVNGILNLSSSNASATQGCLEMSTYVLTMGGNATTTGTGDVTGIVTRTSFVVNTSYSFGNQFTTMNLAEGGTLPGSVSVKIVLTTTHTWKTDAIHRYYDIIRTGGDNATNVTMNLHYLDSELNGATENSLDLFDYHVGGSVEDHGQSNSNMTDNWVGLANLSLTYIAQSSYGIRYWTLGTSQCANFTWIGTSTDWNSTFNWVGGVVPTSTDHVVIPDASITDHDPVLLSGIIIGSIDILSGGILEGGSGTTLTMTSGTDAWENIGTFNAGSSTIVFTNAAATMAGITDFYNVTIADGANLTPGTNNIMRIAGTLSLSATGVLNATSDHNTVEYNGAAQIVIFPNGSTTGYYNLILSGSGAKTMPSSAITVYGDFTMSGTASATAGAALTVVGNFTIGSNTTFNASSFTHSVGGNWTRTGTFTAMGSTINFNGNSASTIGASDFNNISISGTGTKNALGTITASGNFNLTSGAFIFNNPVSNSITIAGNYTQSGGLFDFNTTTSGISSMSLGGNMTQTAGVGSMTTSGAGAFNAVITFNGSGTQTLSVVTPGGAIWVNYSVPSGNSVQLLSDITLNSANGISQAGFQGEIIVNGTFDLGTSMVTQAGGVAGTAVFTVNSGANLITANAGGISGSVSQTNMTTTYSSGANYEFRGASTGTFTTTPTANTVNNLIINNTSAVALTNSLTVAGALSLINGTLTLGTNTLTIAGSSPTRTSGNIDASNTSATITFTNASAIILPASIFTGNVNNLTINGTGGVTANGDFTVAGILYLQSTNPLTTKGSLDMWDGSAVKTLTMGSSATTTGAGDVTGIVKRTTLLADIAYTFGNQYSIFTFENVGTLPTDISMKITIGTAPTWKTDGIKRITSIIRTGGSGSFMTLNVHYLDAELNGNAENILVGWVCITPFTPGTAFELGRSNYDMINNWVGISGFDVSYLPTSFDIQESTLSDSHLTNSTWDGSASTVWTNPDNWDPVGIPSDITDIVIPDATTTLNDPTTNPTLLAGRITLQDGAILNAIPGSTITISGANGAWSGNGGTFNASTSTVIFTNAAATISGITDFYNVTINSGAALMLETDATMRIGGTMTNNGTWRAAQQENSTVEYNGGIQIVLNPNGLTPGYHCLILSGSGIKTLPGSAMDILGDFFMSGSASATPAYTLTVAGTTTLSGTSMLTLGAADILSNTGAVTLNGGTFKTGATTGYSETAGTLDLAENSTIALSTGIHSLTFAASNGISWTSGKTLTIIGWTGNWNGTTGTAGKIFVGNSSSGLTAGQLAQIQFKDSSNNLFPAIILSDGEVVPTGNYISTGTITDSSFCAGTSGISVPFTYSLTTNFSGATFIAQLSNSSGDFASPVTLQNVAYDGSGSQSISVTIPLGTTSGTGYRIRVVSNSPAVTGSYSGDLTVNPLPAIGLTVGGTGSVCSGTGTNITVALSEIDTYYQLWNDDDNSSVGSAVSGTGGSINLPTGNLTSTTTFNILATKSSTNCSAELTGTATITVNARKKISGTFTYYNTSSTVLTGLDITANVYLSSDLAHSTSLGQDVTDGSGYYEFMDLCPDCNYDIVATSTHTAEGAVNTTDAAQVNYFGTHPYLIEKVRFHAGDVGTSGTPSDLTIQATDAGRIQQNFVYGTAFDNTWSFWKTGDAINSATTTESYPPVTLAVGSDLTADMYGLCTGDFNRSFNPAITKSASSTLDLIYSGDRQLTSNQEFDLPLKMVNSSGVGAVSLILNFPEELVEVQNVLMNGAGGQLDWAVKGNELRIGWNSQVPLFLSGGAELVTLKLKTTAAFTIGNSIRLAMASDPLNELADELYNVIGDAVLSIDVIEASTSSLAEEPVENGLILGNYPNPFRNYTIINYTLPFDGKVTLEINSIIGNKVTTLVREIQSIGNHEVKFATYGLPPGLYTATLRIKSANDELIRTLKLINN